MMSNQNEAGTTVDPSPAAESVAGHEYLLEQILELLPAKSLGRFKLVSKHWLSLISKQFRRRRSSSKSPIGMFLRHVSSNATKFVPFDATLHKTRIPSLEFLKNRNIIINNNLDYDVEICKSCHGLLLCLVITDLKDYDYLVCNPTTEQFRLIPRAPGLDDTSSDGVLAFDPCVSTHYKLICARNRLIGRFGAVRLSDDCVIDIYSSEDNSWRVFTSPYMIPMRSFGHYLNGSVFWELYEEEEDEDYNYSYYLRFDVNTEKMTKIRARPLGHEKYFCEYFIEVAVLWWSIMDKNLSEDIHILELSTDSLESWVTNNVDCLLTLLCKYPQIAAQEELQYDPLCVVEGRKEEGSAVLVLAIPGKVISYNLKNKTVKELCDLQDGCRDFKAFPFTESFFAV